MPSLINSNLLIAFDLTNGIALRRIFDIVAGREYLPTPSMLYEFAVNNGPAFQSDTGVSATLISEADDGSGLSIAARSQDGQLGFELNVTFASDPTVVLFQLTAVNLTRGPIFLRVVMPKIFGVSTPGDRANMRLAIPKEAGDVVPWSAADGWGTPAAPLGMQFMIDVGLPNARNNMEVASIFDCSAGGGIFFCDMDGDLDNGIAPLQFNLWSTAVVGFWIGTLAANASVKLPRLAIGVHPDGDWHKAVDYYTSVHRPLWTFPSVPAWFRRAGAIYTPAGGGAGGIYLSLPPANLADAAVWNAWDTGNRAWNLGPVQISPGGFTPTGSLLQAIKQNPRQVTVFAAGFDGAIWATWDSDDGPWHNNRNALFPARITPPGWVTPGAPLACAQQGDTQWDVFFTRPDGSVWVTWEVGDSTWTDGQGGRPFPAQVVPAGLMPPSAHLAAVQQDNNLLCLFGIGNDDAVWFWSVAGLGGWSSGIPITPPRWFPAGAPLAAAKQNDSQLNVFAVDTGGTIRTTWLNSGTPRDGDPLQFSPVQAAPPGAFLAAAKQSSLQLDVFYVGNDGAVWVTWEQSDGFRTDGTLGRLPKPITPAQLAIPGAPLAVAGLGVEYGGDGPDKLQVFVAGSSHAIWVTSEQGDSPWTDGVDGRPGPQPVAGFVPLPSSGIAALARNDSQVDVFCTMPGRIKSFLELPNLLKEANALGANVLYLMDYWEGSDQGGQPPYWNKGDYVPRADLGGEAAFIEGINLVHHLQGRVLLYVEPFIVYQYSAIGQKNGPVWGGRDPSGKLWGLETEDRPDEIYPDYPGYYEMLAPLQAWQDYLVDVAERLVGQYGADGIMLDSYAWQMNRPMSDENVSYSAQDYSRGVLDLVARVRTAIQAINPEAVVIGETTAGPIARYWDGGLNTDLGCGNIWSNVRPGIPPTQTLTATPVPQRLVASPIRYGIPEVRIFGNGLNLGGLHQVYAAGHGLALCSNFPGGGFMFENAAHIQKLVQIREAYGDALIEGAQVNQPRSDNPLVVAYQYQGSTHRILTIVNIGDTDTTANISLNAPDPGGRWINLLDSPLSLETYHTDGSGVLENVALTTGQGSLLVLLNIHRSLSSSERTSVG